MRPRVLSAGAAGAGARPKPKAQSQAQGARRKALELGVAGLALGIDKEVAIALDDLGDKI